MINSGCGLCLELAHDDKTDRTLYVKCKVLENGDVVVRGPRYESPYAYVVATPDGEHDWSWGHYFLNFNDAYEYLMKGEI